jgi:hypothetical protein
MVTLEIGLWRYSSYIVTSHHVFIGMTFQASLSMKFATLLNIINFINRMAAVAINASRSIFLAI